jgi:putative SOS response-associated peptidase YedK
MCGRYTLTDPDPRILRLRFDVAETAKIEEEGRFNIAPTDPVLAIRRSEEGEREPGRLRWGLVPPGTTPKTIGRPLINARAETVRTQGAFKEPFAERRCLLPADGFYEWQKTENGKQPVWMSLPEGELFSFAGLWAKAKDDDGEPLHSCTLITTRPSAQMKPIHNRMPVILPREAEAAWLDPDSKPDDLAELLLPRDGLEIREVSNLVNDVRNDGPDLIKQAEPEPRLF